MTPPHRPRGLFLELAEGIYWFLVLDVLLVLAVAPTLALWTVMSPGPLSSMLFVLGALPMLPAVAAGLHASRAWREDRDLIPARHFLTGYRRNAVDSLKVGTPVLLVLSLVALNLSTVASAGGGALTIALLVTGAISLLVLARVLSIVSTFNFRVRDTFRLAAFTLLAAPLSTLALLSLSVLVLGMTLMVSEFLLLITASLLVFALWASERPVTRLIAERFVSPAAPDEAETAPSPRPLGES